jgi:quinol monooxygenase YgiN
MKGMNRLDAISPREQYANIMCMPKQVESVAMPYLDPDATRLNSGFAVAISITAKEGKGDAVARILENLIAPTMAEEKVRFFVPYQSPTDPLSFFVYELYDDEAGWEAHNKAPHFLSVVDDWFRWPRIGSGFRLFPLPGNDGNRQRVIRTA